MSGSDYQAFRVPGEEVEVDPRDHLLLLPECGADDWTRLLGSTERVFLPAGDVLIAAGAIDRALYFLTKGVLEVSGPRPGRHLRRMRIDAPSVVGEQAFLDSRPRSAEVRAVSDSELWRLTPQGFERLTAENPRLAQAVLFDIGRILSIRLRRAAALYWLASSSGRPPR